MPDQGPSTPSTGKNAYITLLTRPSYLAGALLLAYTLTKHSPSTPLIITYTSDTLGSAALQALKDEAKYSNIILHEVEHLRLPKSNSPDEEEGMVAERFIDTWTKLRVFDVLSLTTQNGEKVEFERICWLDADMMIFSDPSPKVFNASNDAYLTAPEGEGNRLMAVHTCVCNLDHDAWAPKEWKPENCAMAKLQSPHDVAVVESEPYTLSNFNSGTFLWRPSPTIAAFVRDKFEQTGPKELRKMKFPDQDFLNLAFDKRWSALHWSTNALKTWRYWHTNIWLDDRVAVLHYIVDKPWAAHINEDGSAGYLGKDGVTHEWWWEEYERWEKERKEQGETSLLDSVGKYVAGRDGVVDEEMRRSVGGGAQGFAKKWEGKKQGDGDGKGEGEGERGGGDFETKESYGDGPDGPVLRKPMLGERGHGPVVRGRGRGRGEGWSVMEV